MAWATPAVPWTNRSSSNAPTGPFHKTVPAVAMASANRATVSGPMSRPVHPSGMSWPSTLVSPRGPTPLPLPKVPPGSRATTSVGTMMMFEPRSNCRHASMRSMSTRDEPTSWPMAARKVKAMPPPTARTSTRAARAFSTPSLSATLAPPTTATNGRSGSSSRPPTTSTSLNSWRPAALGSRVGGPTTEAWARWHTPKASLT